MAIRPREIASELRKYLQQQSHWKTIACWVLIGVTLLAVVVWFGRDAIAEVKLAEDWIAGNGALGWVAFVGLVVVATSLFIPLSLMAISAGAMFGLGGGIALAVSGAILTAAFNFLISNHLLKTRIETMLIKYPKLKAIQQAAINEGLHLQFLLRLAPISPVTVSYVLGASGVRFSTFMFATIGLIPAVIANVYFGYAAKHVTEAAGNSNEHSTLHTVVTIVGLVVCVVVLIGIGRIASKAIANASSDESLVNAE